MELTTLYTFGSVIVVSLIAVLCILPFLFKKELTKRVLLIMLSLSVGTLMGDVFIHLLPEAVKDGYTLAIGLYALLGFLALFVLEKLIHWHHNHGPYKTKNPHGHAYHLAPLNLVGDGVHNFLDGLVIAGAYLASIPVGVATTLAVIFHEVPQEVADFGVLLYAGLRKSRAVMFNLISALAALVGAGIGLFLSQTIVGFQGFILPFAAGNFVYIAASNLVPELHRQSTFKDTFVHLIAIAVGIAVMVGLTFLE